MSDSLSDIAKDQRRSEKYSDYIVALLDHLDGEASREQVIEAAKHTDSVGGGYWGGQTNLSDDIERRIDLLRSGDEREWAKLLDSLARDKSWLYSRYYRAKKMSPWSGKLLIHMDYGCGFETIKCPDLSRIIRKAGMKTLDCDDYVVAVAVSDDDPDVVWTDCGILGQDGPRETGLTERGDWRTPSDTSGD